MPEKGGGERERGAVWQTPILRGEEVYLPPTSISGNVYPIQLKIGLKVSRDYSINYLPYKIG